MKKKLTFITSLLCAALVMSSCTLTRTIDHSDSSGGSGTNTDSSESDTEHGSETETETETTEESTPRSILSTRLYDEKESYDVGDVFKTDNGVMIEFTYSDESVESSKATITKYTLNSSPLDEAYKETNPFKRAGEYQFSLKASYKDNGSTKYVTENINVTVNSLVGLHPVKELTMPDLGTLGAGDHLNDKLDIDLTYTITKDGNDIEELVRYDYHDTTNYELKVYKAGVLTDIDIENYTLELGTSYRIEIVCLRTSMMTSFSFDIEDNYYRLNADDLSLLASDIDYKFAPAKGEVKMLIIPITLKGNWIDNWTTSRLNAINGYYFDENEPLSLKSYYEDASFGQMEVSGMVSETYVENDSSLTTDLIMADTSYNKLFQLIDNAVTYIEENHPEINFTDYDLNDDGCLDNVHLITNFNTNTYKSQTGNNPWSTPLWPHKYQTGDVGTLAKPKANVYSISANDHVNDAITAIHEQGHIFGLSDYYDYGYTGADYVGAIDMQSNNVMDWNSYSKLTMGWVSPYVVKDECEITINAASLNGDCIIVPANESTFNGSAFDEYFLIELFSPYGNNAKFSSIWNNYIGLNKYGVRLYHVDSRVYGYNGHDFYESTTAQYLYVPCDNNCYGYSSRSSYFQNWKDYKLLALIQRGGTDTFGHEEEDSDHPVYRHVLRYEDLFKKDDVFTFNQYKSFLSKSGASVTSMDNGESFPYKITFTDMSIDSVTIKIEKL